MLGRTPLAAAIRALREELAGGPRADLGRDVRELEELLAQRELRRFATVRGPAEQELLAALPDAAALVSKEGWVRASNAAFDTLAATGRAAGLTPLEITRSAELHEAVRRALEGTARRLELTIQRRTYLAHLSPLLRGEVLVLLRDVTEAKRAAATRRDFVANASHELRTPISAIRAAAETLLSGAMDDATAAHGFVEIVARQADRLSRLTQDLLDLSRIESKQWTLEVAPVDAAPFARQALEPAVVAAREKGLALRSEVPEGTIVRADPRALEQVLVNLVDNAVKYTAEGSVAIRAAREGNDWIISVVDTGPGIERHHLERIFERFYRVDAGRSREAGGTGLGLAIVKHLVQGMGGEIGVESGAGGSRFWVRLPAV
ncbi:sensor histidine kinase [Anaeromyxobacter oryzae]|uniref:histidine kinase n=1 Tax=Anaeromyxobacter oryzae TaxID=2918170 RepID=A0ABN6MWW9_9BACT|nr:ATP-binding protein [Anaeromyxobacter oryzae]BDG04003.1 PAS domain-containing sensor histidine kinase [Anaeromyxobacter oryzae]